MTRFPPLLFAGFAVLAAPLFAAKVDFNYDIRPLISSKCFHCHGPDEHSREAGLRLDLRAEAIKERDGVTAIVPGDPAASELYVRITTKDRDELMPPPKEDHALSVAEIALFRRWIEEGAEYKPHWSFVKPVRPAVPQVEEKFACTVRNPIDAFVLAKLAGSSLSPSPEAARETLIRRVALDLTGLPPTPGEIAAFVADDRPDAYEQLVDRLLASPAYGERWAKMWLDLARYADSTGYGSDKFRMNVWPYRDWVINAFNRNLPYDQFSTEQLAGDLLPDATTEQRVATAFHRNTMTNVEGGTNDEEWRVAAVKDRIATTGQVWMGLTVGCAQCHTHKFDPITHRDYYRFFGVFNQTEDSDREDEEPKLPLPTAAESEKTARVKAEIARLEARLRETSPALEAELSAWEETMRVPAVWQPLRATALHSASGAELGVREDGVIAVTSLSSPTDFYTLRFSGPIAAITALRIESVPEPGSKGAGRFATGDFALSEVRASVATAEPMAFGAAGNLLPAKEKARIAKLFNASASFEKAGQGAALAIDGSKDTGWSTSGGSGGGSQALVLPLAQPVAVLAGEELTVTLHQNQREQTLGNFRVFATAQSGPVRELTSTIRNILALAPEGRSVAQHHELLAYFRPLSVEFGPVQKELDARRAELAAIKPVALPILRELASEQQRATHILLKGNYLAPGETVQPGLIAEFAAHVPADSPVDRRTVARWLFDGENPLTARVTVNRFWARLFGIGLVETEEDFGSQGALPSHPELLDWLAVAFQSPKTGESSQPSTIKSQLALGWDTKALLRLLVTSATYRQSSAVTPAMLEQDARNRLLARAPRLRLEAEAVRDQALALSGLLSAKMGGPSVYPPQPDGLWKVAFNGGQNGYPTSQGEDRYRRGIYTFWRRTMPPPSMTTFDAPSRESCTLRRQPTNTPLQAFVTMNDPAFVECAQALARRLLREGGAENQERIQFGLRLCTGRAPAEAQVSALLSLYESELAVQRTDLPAALKLATEPLGPLPSNTDPAELAAWTVVANVLLNLDAVLTKN